MADNEMKKDKELDAKKLTDKQLTDANGGGFKEWLDSGWFYESGDTPKWKLNRRVSFARKGQIDYGVITAISSTKNGGKFYKEFTYTIRYYEGDEVSGIYESAIEGYADFGLPE